MWVRRPFQQALALKVAELDAAVADVDRDIQSTNLISFTP